MKEIIKDWGVVYLDTLILGIKTPTNDVYPASDVKIFECETKDELDIFIAENNLSDEIPTT